MIVMIKQPENFYADAGALAVFQIKASGNGLAYQWQYANTLQEPLVFKNTTETGYAADTLILAVTEDRVNARCYRCVISDAEGNVLVSEPGYLYSTDKKPDEPIVDGLVALEEMKLYLRVDFSDDDSLIEYLISSAEKICMDIVRTDDVNTLKNEPNAKAAVFYAVAYLYEHREEADHHALTITLRSLLFGSRKEAF